MARLRFSAAAFLLLAVVSVSDRAPAVSGDVHTTYLDAVVASKGDTDTVELYVRALNRSGDPAGELPAGGLEVLVDGAPVPNPDLQIEPLEDTDRGVAVALVLDVSSQASDQFDSIKRDALEFMNRVRPTDLLEIITFGSEPEVLSSLDDSSAMKQVRVDNLEREKASDSIRLFDGIDLALRNLREYPDLPRRAFVVVLAAGESQGDVRNDAQLTTALRAGVGIPRIPLFAVGYSSDGQRMSRALGRLAADSTGLYLAAGDSKTLRRLFFDDIWRQMSESFLIRFEADFDGANHAVSFGLGGSTLEEVRVGYPDGGLSVWLWAALAFLLILILTGVIVFALFKRRKMAAGYLETIRGAPPGRFPLREGESQVGRNPDNDVHLGSDAVSEWHAIIRVSGRSVEIEDRRSSNGTFVDGTRVSRATLIEPGARIRFADVELVFDR